MAQQYWTDEQIAEYKEAFDFFDTDGNDFISSKEFGNVMRAMGQNPTNKEIECMIKQVDEDGNGSLDFHEFLNMMAVYEQEHQDPEGDLREAFQVFDMDGNGYISAKELRKAMKMYGEKLSDKEAREMVNDVDVDGDEHINYEEFVTMYTCKK